MRLVRTVATTAVGIALLTSCSDGETANETLPPASSSAAETSEPLPPLGPSDMPMPAEARARTPEGIASFTTYYMSLINRLGNDLDSSHLRALSRNCSTCDRIADDADSDLAAGRAYRGGSLIITSIGQATLTSTGGEVAFVVDQEPLEVLSSDGATVEELSSPRLTALPAGLSTTWNSDHWVVTALSFG